MNIPHASGRAARTLEYLFADIMEKLIEIFLECAPDQDKAAFMENIYEKMRLGRARGDQIERDCKARNDGKLSRVDLMLISCTYCIQSGQARHDKAADLAWAYLMDAQFYLGMARAADVSEPQVANFLQVVSSEALTAEARKNVTISVDPWHKAKAEAIRLVRQQGAAGKRWDTFDAAAEEIAVHIRAYVTKLRATKKFMGDEQSVSTISRWLNEAQDVREFITSCGA